MQIATMAKKPKTLSSLDRFLERGVRTALGKIEIGRLTVIQPDGESAVYGDPESTLQATVWVRDSKLWWRMARHGDIGLGEAYVDGLWDADDVAKVLEIGHLNERLISNKAFKKGLFSSLWHAWVQFSRRNTKRSSRHNIAQHYDLGDDLFNLFLDPTMSYSCGLFQTKEDSLQRAQENKIDAILEKAQLSEEHHLLEIGCGWGSLSVEAAKRYGCRVKGITLSENQLKASQERARREGVEDLVQFELVDYRDVQGQFDRIISIEMIEAVGHEYLQSYFGACERLLAPDGIMVLQSIMVVDQFYDEYRHGFDFLRKYIFPGGLAPCLRELSLAMSKASELTVESMESIGPHYATTLRRWREQFDSNAAALRERGYDDRFQRLWHYYLGYCEAGFSTRSFLDCQFVLTRPRNMEIRSQGMFRHTKGTLSPTYA